MRPVGGLLAVAVALAVPASAARAGDEPEHRYLTYAIALAAGYSPAEAKIMSDGAWSLDMNSSTTALNGAGIDSARLAAAVTAIAANKDLSQRLLNPRDTSALDKELFTPDSAFGRIGQGAFYHALFKDPAAVSGQGNTPSLDAAWPRYISQQLAGLKDAGVQGDDLKTAKLLLVGQYMHQLMDSYVHPTDPVKGHATDGHAPDYAINNPQRYAEAAQRMLDVLRSNPDFRPAKDDPFKTLKLDAPEDRARFARDLVNSLARGYDSRFDPDNPDSTKWGLRKNLLSLSDDVKDKTKGSVEAFMNRFLKERGYFDKFPDDGKGGKFSAFKIGDYTPANYAANKDDPTRFRVSYDDKALAGIDNFVQWVLKRPEYQKLVDSVREDVRERIRDVALSQMLDDKIRTLKDAIVARVTRGEKPDDATLKALEVLEAKRAERLQKMTVEEKLAELERLLLRPDSKADPDILDLARSLGKAPRPKALRAPGAAAPPKGGYVIPPKKDPADLKVPHALRVAAAALPPVPSPPGPPEPKLGYDENARRRDPTPQPKKPLRQDDPPKEKPKEKKAEGPFTVNYYRKGDYPKGGELYGIFKTRAEAMQAVAAIRRWAATIKDPTWSIEVIEVSDDSTGQTQVLRLQANGSSASPRGTGNGAGVSPDNLGPGWVNATPRPRPRPPLKLPPAPHPKHPDTKQGGAGASARQPHHPPDKNRPGRGGKRITYEDKEKKVRLKPQQSLAGNKNTKPLRGKEGKGEKKPSGIGTAALKPTGSKGSNSGKPSRVPPASKPVGNKLRKPGNTTSGETGGKPSRPGSTSTRPVGRPSTQGTSGVKPHKPGSSVQSPSHRPHSGSPSPVKPSRPTHQTGPSGTPYWPSPRSPSHSSAPVMPPFRPSAPPQHGSSHPPRSQNDGRAQARSRLMGQLQDVNARIRQHNSYKPNPYDHAAVNAYNAEARALNSEKARIRSQLP